MHRRERARWGVGRLVLTHLGAEMRARAEAVRAEGFLVAEDGDVYAL